MFKVYNIALDDEFSLSNILLRIRDGLGVTEVTKQTLKPGTCSGICPGEGLHFFFLSKAGGLVAPPLKTIDLTDPEGAKPPTYQLRNDIL